MKFKNILVDSIDYKSYCYDILKENYSNIAKEKLFENYKNNFCFSGQVSYEVKEKLFKQLLLMRLFFEVYKDSNSNVITLDKYKIFQSYLNDLFTNNNEKCRAFFDRIVQEMCNTEEYTFVKKSRLKGLDYTSNEFNYLLDESILLSRKLIYHPNSILEKYDEEIYFVFDEMRDYCIAKYTLESLCDECGNPIEERVIHFMDNLTEKDSVSTEGVINYFYYFFKEQGNEKTCKYILETYVKPRDKSLSEFWMNRESGLRCWGSKLIFESDEDLKEYEYEYLDFIASENPEDEVSRIFTYLVNQEKMKMNKNLNIYFNMLFRIHEKNKFTKFLKSSISRWNDEEIKVSDFIEVDKMLQNYNSDGCSRFRIFVYIFINFFQWEGRDEVNEYLKNQCDFESLSAYLKDKIHLEDKEVKR